ncbi:uncharacterized protein LOC126778465 [Nymphalis io]|uniref:uncharacterized protein LOC126778465 n=1 Tax=Inachis io TaxID=171585 RepID=UPI00216A37CA|nr:uncharacterized protein LOC126778465 [Nymphalis io]
MLLALILCCYLTSLKALENEPNQKSNLEEQRSSDCPNTAILLKAIYILTNLIPQDTTMLEPEKLNYGLSTVMRFLEKEPSKDKFKLNNNLNNLESQLDKIIARSNERVLRDKNAGNSKEKFPSQYETPMTYKCEYILGTLIYFIKNAYMHVANYCRLTGKCSAYDSAPLSLNFSDNILSHNTMSQNQKPLHDFKYLTNYETPLTKADKENNAMPQVSQEMKQDYDIMSILQNYKPISDIKQAKDVLNYYPVENLENRKQKSYNEILKPFVYGDKENYALNGISPQQLPSRPNDFNNISFKDIFSAINNLNTNTNQKETNMLADAVLSANNIPIQSYPTVIGNKNPLQDYTSSYFQQGIEQNSQYLTNHNKEPELIKQIPQQYVGIPNNQNFSPYPYPYPYQSYKESPNQNTQLLGLNQKPQYKLTIPNSLTSQYNKYVIPNAINTIIADNTKQENYGTQLPASSQPLSVSNLVKLNSVPKNYGNVELTFMLKRSQPVYEPLFYVKYKMPYNEFLYNIQNLLIQKPYLRSKPNQLYQELLSGSNVIKTSENLKDLNDEELVKLTSTNGTLITAKLLEDRDNVDNEKLKAIQDLNANLSVANFLNLNMSNNQTLEPIQKLLKATMTATGYDNSFKSYSDAERSGIMNGYINSDYNTPIVYQPSPNDYNPYSKILGPAYSTLYGIPFTGYNTQSNNIVEKLSAVNSQSQFNSYPQLAG